MSDWMIELAVLIIISVVHSYFCSDGDYRDGCAWSHYDNHRIDFEFKFFIVILWTGIFVGLGWLIYQGLKTPEPVMATPVLPAPHHAAKAPAHASHKSVNPKHKKHAGK